MMSREPLERSTDKSSSPSSRLIAMSPLRRTLANSSSFVFLMTPCLVTITRYRSPSKLIDRESSRYLLARRQREQVDERRAARLARRIGNFVAAQPVDAPLVREEEHVIVRLRDEEVAHDVFALEVRDAGHAAPTAVLRAEGIDGDALDVAADGIRNDDVDVGRDLLDRDLVFGRLDGSTALVAKAFLKVERLVLDDLRDAARTAQNVVELRDCLDQRGVLVFDLLALEADQRPQAHIDDRLRLYLTEIEALRKALFGFVGGLAPAYDLDDFVDVVERDPVAFEQVRALFGFPKIVGACVA